MTSASPALRHGLRERLPQGAQRYSANQSVYGDAGQRSRRRDGQADHLIQFQLPWRIPP